MLRITTVHLNLYRINIVENCSFINSDQFFIVSKARTVQVMLLQRDHDLKINSLKQNMDFSFILDQTKVCGSNILLHELTRPLTNYFTSPHPVILPNLTLLFYLTSPCYFT